MKLAISDKKQGRLAIFDLAKMSLIHLLDVGAGAYPCDHVAADLLYVSTRDLKSVTPVSPSSGTVHEPIPLGHQPRSTTLDAANGLAFIGGRERVIVTIIDVATSAEVGTVGSGDTDHRRDFGGGLACGHPAVGPDGEVILLDRVARRIETYRVDSRERVDSLNLPSSPHHVHAHDGVYFALCEGSRTSRIAPSVMAFRVAAGKLTVVAHRFLPVLRGDWAATGGHHLTLDDEQGHVYVGTSAGWIYTLSMTDLSVVHRTEAGAGCGHVTLCPSIGLGVATNHTDTFMTVFDLRSGRRVRDITVSTPTIGGAKTQGHTSVWDDQVNRLFTTAAQDGKLLELDPLVGEVTREVTVPDADLIQGCRIR